MTQQNPAHKPGITPLFVLNALKRWWLFALPVGLVLGSIGMFYVHWSFVPKYEASVLLRMYSETPWLAFRNASDAKSFRTNQMALMRSPMVLGEVISRPEIARLSDVRGKSDPIEALAKEIGISSRGRSDMFNVTFTSPNPQNAAAIANAITETYFATREKFDTQRSQMFILKLEQEQADREMEIEALREEVREMAKQATGRDPYAPPLPGGIKLVSPLATLQDRLTSADVEATLLRARVAAIREDLKNQGEVIVPPRMIEQSLAGHPAVQQLEAKIAVNEQKLRGIEQQGTGDVQQLPLYQRYERELKRDEEALESLTQELRPQLAESLKEVLTQQRNDELELVQAKLEAQGLTQSALKSEFEKQLSDAQTFTGETLDLEFKRAELTRAQEVSNLIASRIVKLKTEQRAPEPVELLMEAAVPTKPVATIPTKQLGVAGLGGLLFPFLLAFAWEYRLKRVSDRGQLEQLGGMKVVGEIASLPVRGTGTLRNGSRSLALFEESVDSLRTCLILSEPIADARVLAITSAATREGKTSVAAQLAVSIARATRGKTLLIDGDMRRPDIHELFDVPGDRGLSEVLEGECTLQEAIVSSSDTLHLLPAGILRSNPHRLVGNGAFQQLIDEARQHYDHVIIDTPPILPAAEALIMARAADASLVCAMCEVSREVQVRNVYDRLQNANARPVGVVLSGVPAKRYSYSYGYYGYGRT